MVRVWSRMLSAADTRQITLFGLNGRNFGLKSEGTNSEGERGALGPEVRGEENGEEVLLPHPTLGSGIAS